MKAILSSLHSNMHPKITLICITQTSNFDRHANIFKTFSALNSAFGNQLDLHLIYDQDTKDLNLNWNKSYAPNLWRSHIEEIAFLLLPNMLSSNNSQFGNLKSVNWKLRSLDFLGSLDSLFKTRPLSIAESDILKKHWLALSVASNENCLSLVLEDDSIFNESIPDTLRMLLNAFQSDTRQKLYVDLCNYPSFIDFYESDKHLFDLKIAITRTLCAYLISPAMAKILINNFTPFSLPVDLHYQYIFSKLKVDGKAVRKESCFSNGSHSGHFKTSIQT